MVRRVLFLIVMIVAGAARGADAQVLGYAIAGPAGFHGFFGSNSSGVHGAAGAEALILGRAGVGAEFGVIANAGGGLLVFSANGVLHVLRATGSRRPSPFLTGGYTRMSSGEGDFEAWNAGAGVDIWPKD